MGFWISVLTGRPPSIAILGLGKRCLFPHLNTLARLAAEDGKDVPSFFRNCNEVEQLKSKPVHVNGECLFLIFTV